MYKNNNFILRKRNSFIIGIYLLIATFCIQTILSQFLTDDSPIQFLSIENLEWFITFIAYLTALFSAFAIFISGRRNAKQKQIPVWNASSKKTFLFFIIGIVFLPFLGMKYAFLNTTLSLSTLIYLGYLLLIFASHPKKSKPILLFTASSIVLLPISNLLNLPWFFTWYVFGFLHLIFSFIFKK